MSINKAIIVGNLTKDPEQRCAGSGIAVTSFTVAVQRRFKSQDGQQQTDFIPVVCWRGLAENVAKYCFKGSKVGVVGTIGTRSYDDANGIRRYVTEIIADEVEFLNSRRDSQQSDYAPQQGQAAGADELSDFQPLDKVNDGEADREGALGRDSELPF